MDWTTTMNRIATTALLGIAITVATVSPALAQDAREHFLRGQAAYNQGDYESALREWEAAYELDARPRLQFNISQAYERLGRLAEALRALERYLSESPPDDEHQSEVRARAAGLRERLSRTAIVIEGGPEGATIVIDGEDRGRTPRPDPLAVDPGEHLVVVQLGERRFESQVVVPAAQSIRVHIPVLEDVASTSDGPEETAPVTGEPPIASIVVLSGAGIALVTGAILAGVAVSSADAARTSDDANASSARAFAIGADVGFGVSLAAAIGGVALAIVQSSGGSTERERTGALDVTPWAAPSGAGASATLRF